MSCDYKEQLVEKIKIVNFLLKFKQRKRNMFFLEKNVGAKKKCSIKAVFIDNEAANLEIICMELNGFVIPQMLRHG